MLDNNSHSQLRIISGVSPGAGESDEDLAKRLQDLFDKEAGTPARRPVTTPPAAAAPPDVRPRAIDASAGLFSSAVTLNVPRDSAW